jgi:hypothetical protein
LGPILQGRTIPLPLADLGRNLWAACHLLLLRRSALRWLTPSPGNFLILLWLSLCASFLFDLMSEGWPGQWSPAGVAVYALPAFVVLVFGQILSTRHGLWRLGLAPAIAWLAADILLGIGQGFLQYADRQGWLSPLLTQHIPQIYLFLPIWPIFAVVFVFTRALAWPLWERFLAFVVLLGVFSAWSLTFSDERLWYSTQEEEAPALVSRLTEEEVMYAQPDLLQRALAGLLAQDPRRTDWYFLGIGGAYYQNVFRTETESVRSLFDTRFATSGRSLVLINNDDSVLRQPVATRTSISRSLHAIAGRMDRDNDVLFLFLTSHGSPDHQIELSYWPLVLSGITPEWLRATLDASGIKRRVIVLSACYSGGFIPALKSPDTLIITASDAGNPSFGCSDDAELTYFGRAFFDEAMRREYSFQSAFELAKMLVAERESAEHFEPSRPQWEIGERMQVDLPILEKTLFPPSP